MKEDPLKSVELSEKKEGSMEKLKMKNEEEEVDRVKNTRTLKIIREDAENITDH